MDLDPRLETVLWNKMLGCVGNFFFFRFISLKILSSLSPSLSRVRAFAHVYTQTHTHTHTHTLTSNHNHTQARTLINNTHTVTHA
jgi:hypothetical protein